MKKVIYILALSAGLLSLAACGGKDKEEYPMDDEDTSLNAAPVQFASYAAGGDSSKTFGKAISAEGASNVQNLMHDSKAENYTGKVTGTVVSVCQNKGCWMKLDAGNGQTMMVTFKDYGFFVPKDIAGQTVVIDGVAAMKTVSVEEQRHYAKDAGKTQAEIDAITQPKTELSFVADGVLLVK